MKGIVFTSLADMVEESHGIEVWENVIEGSGAAHEGVYTAGQNYPDSELFDLVEALRDELNVDTNDLIRAFGVYLFDVLISLHPHFIEQQPTFIGFLKSIQDVIHIEVRKLYDDAVVPDFLYEQQSEQTLTMHYQSPRKLCMLAEGLIEAAAKKYQVKYHLEHSECMHKGAQQCTFEIQSHD